MFCQKSFFRRIGALGLFFLTGFFLFAGDTGDLPAWLLYEKGINFFQKGELDKALELFTLSCAKGQMIPESLYWTGRIYQAEGDYFLAERRYGEALEKSPSLYIPEEKWNIHYSLSDIYYDRKDYAAYEQVLLKVFEDEQQNLGHYARREDSILQMLKNRGLDKVLQLHRLELRYSLEACFRLGQYYNDSEMWDKSMAKNTFVLLSSYTRGIAVLMENQPDFFFPMDMDEAWKNDGEFLARVYEGFCRQRQIDFEFTRNIENFELSDLPGDRQLSETLVKKKTPGFIMTVSGYVLLKIEDEGSRTASVDYDSLYPSLFFLGEAFYQAGYPERARELWSILASSRHSSSWRTLAYGKIL